MNLFRTLALESVSGPTFSIQSKVPPPITDLAIVTEEFRPSQKGGIATWAHGIAVYFGRQENYNVTVFVKKRGGISSNTHLNPNGFNIELMGGRDWARFKKWYVQFYLKQFLKLMKNPVIISANWELSEGLVKYKKKFKFSLITVLHGLEVTRLQSKKYRKKIPNFKQTLSQSDHVIAVSNYTKQEALSISGQDKIRIIPNFVDIEAFYPKIKNDCRDQFNFSNTDKILVTLSRLIKRKGHDIVIKALQSVKKEMPEIKYLIAGGGDKYYEKQLKLLVSKLNLEQNVIFMGYIDENKKNTLYNACNIYIMNSLDTNEEGDSEGFGITFLEANACGLPVIGSKTGGILDAIEDYVNGLLVEPNNPDETAKAIHKLFSDDKLYQQISDSGISRVKSKYSLSHVGEIYQQVISNLSA